MEDSGLRWREQDGPRVIEAVIPDDTPVIRVPVEPGDTVVLPFGPDAPLEARGDNGNLAINADDETVILEGYIRTLDDPDHPVVVETSDGAPLDVAVVLASTDPNLDITCQGALIFEPSEVSINTGGIFQIFAGGVALRAIEAIGPIGADAPALQGEAQVLG